MITEPPRERPRERPSTETRERGLERRDRIVSMNPEPADTIDITAIPTPTRRRTVDARGRRNPSPQLRNPSPGSSRNMEVDLDCVKTEPEDKR